MPPLTYKCKEQVSVGCRVVVFLGSQGISTKTGIVVAVYDELAPQCDPAKIRELAEVIDTVPLVLPRTLQFWSWLSQYYISYWGEVIRPEYVPILSATFAPRSVVRGKSKGRKNKVAVQPPPMLKFPIESEVKTVLIHEDSPLNIASFVDQLTIHDGTILIVVPTCESAKLVASQLAPWWSVGIYTSAVTIQKRGLMFVDAAVGTLNRVIVGTRQALSLPFAKLGAVVVLDEHSAAYKSQRSPRISTRDAALYLSRLHNAYCYLVSSVPSIESSYNAKGNGWQVINTPSWPIPPLNYIVLERGKELLSKYLISQIAEAIEKGRKAVVFQNRRGFSSYVECNRCHHIVQCPSCNTSLTYHLDQKAMVCHYCGHSEPFDGKCKECSGQLEHYGRGTQRIEQQLAKLFPSARMLRVDADSANETPKIKNSTGWDIMVGTQMLLDPQIDFEDVDVVGVANADNMSPSADFRDAENTFRLLSLLARRARMANAEMIVQSTRLDNLSINFAMENDYAAMYNKEIVEREQANYPPFVRLIKVEIRSAKERKLFQSAKTLEEALRSVFGDRISPIFQPIVPRQNGEHIVHILMRIERSRSANDAKERLMQIAKPIIKQSGRDVTFTFDVDPQ